MDIERELGSYLRRELVKPRGKNPIIKFVLRHASPGAKGNEVESWDHDSSISLEDIPRLAADILGRAQTDADGMGPGTHRYTVSAIAKGEGKTTRLMFRLRGGEEEGDDLGGDESPTVKGLVSQLMRHNEAMARTQNSSIGAMMSLMVRRLESQDHEMTQMRLERSETFLALEAAKSQAHERDMVAMEAVSADRRKDQAFNKLLQLAPVVVNRIAGKNLLPSKTSPLDMMIENLVGSLSPDQFQAIASQLGPEQQLVFVEVLQTFQRQKQAKERSEAEEANEGKKEN